MALIGLRGALYLQLLLGVLLILNVIGGPGVRTVHISLGILVAVSAIFVLRPLPAAPNNWVRSAARFAPLVAFAISFVLQAFGIYGASVGYIHVALGIATIGIVEAAAAGQRRE